MPDLSKSKPSQELIQTTPITNISAPLGNTDIYTPLLASDYPRVNKQQFLLGDIEYINKLRGQNQPGWKQAGNAVFGGLAGAAALAIEDISYLPIVNDIIQAIDGTEEWERNAIAQAMVDAKSVVYDEWLPIYQEDPNKLFEMSSGAFWNGFRTLEEQAIGFAVPGAAIAKGLGKVQRLARASQYLNFLKASPGTAQALNTIGSGFLMNHAEGRMMAIEEFSRTEQELKTDRENGLNDLSDAQIAEVAGETANYMQQMNRLLMVTDMFQIHGVLKGKGYYDNIINNPKRGLKDAVTRLDSENLILQGLTESFEEVTQSVIGQKGSYDAKRRAGIGEEQSFAELLGETLSKEETAYEALMGFLGGAGTRVVTESLLESKQGKEDRQKYYDLQQQQIKNNAEFAEKKLNQISQFDKLKKKAIEVGGDTDVLEIAADNMNLMSMALENFKKGTYPNLVQQFQDIKNISPEEAKKRGLDENYRANADKALNKLDDLKKDWITASKYEQADKVFKFNQGIKDMQNIVDNRTKAIEEKREAIKKREEAVANSPEFKISTREGNVIKESTPLDEAFNEESKKVKEAYKAKLKSDATLSALKNDLTKLESAKTDWENKLNEVTSVRNDLISGKTQAEIFKNEEKAQKFEGKVFSDILKERVDNANADNRAAKKANTKETKPKEDTTVVTDITPEEAADEKAALQALDDEIKAKEAETKQPETKVEPTSTNKKYEAKNFTFEVLGFDGKNYTLRKTDKRNGKVEEKKMSKDIFDKSVKDFWTEVTDVSQEKNQVEPDNIVIEDKIDNFLNPLVQLAEEVTLEKRKDALPFNKERFENKVKSLKNNINNKNWKQVEKELTELFSIINEALGNTNKQNNLDNEEIIMLLGKLIFNTVSNEELSKAVIAYKEMVIQRSDTAFGFPTINVAGIGKAIVNNSGEVSFILTEANKRGILTQDYYDNTAELAALKEESTQEELKIIQSNKAIIKVQDNVIFGTSSKQGENNEDALYVDIENGIFILADGMGGESSPAFKASDASKAVINLLLGKSIITGFDKAVQIAKKYNIDQQEEFVKEFTGKDKNPWFVENALKELFVSIKTNKNLVNTKQQRSGATALKATHLGNNTYQIEKVGDTVFFVVKNGNISQIHGLSAVSATQGYMFSVKDGKSFIHSPEKDVFTITLNEGETLVLSTDFIETETAVRDFIDSDFGKNLDFEKFQKKHKNDDSTFISIGYKNENVQEELIEGVTGNEFKSEKIDPIEYEEPDYSYDGSAKVENVEQDSNVNEEDIVTNKNILAVTHNKIAYLNRDHIQLEKKIEKGTRIDIQDATDIIKDDYGVLNPNNLSKTDVVTFEVMDMDSVPVYDIFRIKDSTDNMTWGEFKELNKDIIGENLYLYVPIAIKKGDNIVGYVHRYDWIRLENSRDVEENKKNLEHLRKQIVVQNITRGSIKSISYGKAARRKDKKKVSIFSAAPNVKVSAVRKGKVVQHDVVNDNKTLPEGTPVSITVARNGKKIAIPMDPKTVESVRQDGKQVLLDEITDILYEFAKYLSTGVVSDKLKEIVKTADVSTEVGEYLKNFIYIGNRKEGYPQVKITSTSLDLNYTNADNEEVRIFVNKGKPIVNAFKSNVKNIVGKMFVNLNTKSLGKTISIAGSKVPYDDFVKQTHTTNLLYFPVGDSYTVFIQPVIKFELEENLMVHENIEDTLTDDEYNNFIDRGVVSQERIASIAEKVRSNQKLSQRELQIFNDKTSDINKKLKEIKESETTEKAGKKIDKKNRNVSFLLNFDKDGNTIKKNCQNN